MNRLFALIFASLVVVPALSGKTLARTMGAGDVRWPRRPRQLS